MKTRRIVIGIDGDSARSSACLFNSESSLLADSTTAGCDFTHMNYEAMGRSILEIVTALCDKANIGREYLAHIAIATTGNPSIAAVSALRKKFGQLWSRRKHKPELSLRGRAPVVLQTYISSSPAIAVEYGAQVTLCARTGQGRYIYIGGWGDKINYGGGGQYVGNKTINSLALYYDRRLVGSMLGQAAEKNLGIKSREDFLRKLYEEDLSPVEFIPVVMQAAQERDPLARNIIDTAADEVVDCIRFVATRFPIKEMIPLILFGDMVNRDDMFGMLIRKKIRATVPQISIKNITVNLPEAAAKYALSTMEDQLRFVRQKRSNA
jgi:N-acetylglucosamine kinase-like BadF-type ATPase